MLMDERDRRLEGVGKLRPAIPNLEIPPISNFHYARVGPLIPFLTTVKTKRGDAMNSLIIARQMSFFLFWKIGVTVAYMLQCK